MVLFILFPGFGNSPKDWDYNVNKAAAIYTSTQRENIIDLVNWLVDPRDN